MDYLAEIANSADLIEALGRVSVPDVAKSLLDLNHPYGALRMTHPNLWMSELINVFYGHPRFAADVWRELQYCHLARVEVATRALEMIRQSQAGSASRVISPYARHYRSEILRSPEYKNSARSSINFLYRGTVIRAAWASALLEDAFEQDLRPDSVLDLADALQPATPGDAERNARSTLVLAHPDTFSPRDLMDQLRDAANVAWNIPGLLRKLYGDRGLIHPDIPARDSIFNIIQDRGKIIADAQQQGCALPFAIVHELELNQVLDLRKATGRDTDYDQARPPEWQDDHNPIEIRNKASDLPSASPIRKAIDHHLVGLAFSGGGIRSATFNLGVLQSLAELDLLRHCDYLSTVSGGGYIGCWFSAWTQRLRGEGAGSSVKDVLSEIYRRLSPAQSPHPLDDRVRPIRYLREFSNYLTPKAGVMSADTWTMVAIYLRNALLNLLILVPVVAATLLAPRFVFKVTELLYSQTEFPLLVPLMIAGCLGVAVWVLILNARRKPPENTAAQVGAPMASAPAAPEWFARQGWIQATVVVPLLLAGWLASVSAYLWLHTQNVSDGVLPLANTKLHFWLELDLAPEGAFPHRPWITATIAGVVAIVFSAIFSYFRPSLGSVKWWRDWRNAIYYIAVPAVAAAAGFRIPSLPLGPIGGGLFFGALLLFRQCWRLRKKRDVQLPEEAFSSGIAVLAGTLLAAILWFLGQLLVVPPMLRDFVHAEISRLGGISPASRAAITGAVLVLPLLIVVFGAGRGFFKYWKRRAAWATLIFASVGSSLAAFGLFGAVCAFLANDYDQRNPEHGFWMALIFGPPLVLAALALAVALQLGLLGTNYPDEHREWWSRLRAWILIYSVVWTLWFVGAVYPPVWLKMLVDRKIDFWSGAGAVVVWALSTFAGIRASPHAAAAEKAERESSSLSSSAGALVKNPRLLKAISTIAPYIFIGGLLVSVSLGVNAIARSAAGVDYFAPGNNSGQQPWYSYYLYFNGLLGLAAVLLLGLAALISCRVGVNEFSMHHFYKNRLVRCYLGASRWKQRMADWFTGFDSNDDIRLAQFDHQGVDKSEQKYPGPYPIVNAALNLVGGEDLAWQERKATSFVFTPKFCGFDVDRALLTQHQEDGDIWPNGYAPTREYAYPVSQRPDRPGPSLGTAMAISGAAANPNMGKVTSPASAFLMTVFNVRLGWWLPNPRRPKLWKYSGPRLGINYSVFELFGLTDDRTGFVNVSDGGHFENLGVYELIRRGCRCVIVCDSGQDGALKMEDLGNLIRKCRTDFGVEIEIDAERIRCLDEKHNSAAHCVVGKIHYSGIPRHDKDGRLQFARQSSGEPPAPLCEEGWLVYLKPSITGDEPADVLEYYRRVPEFPHESTADQWFNESQFESYRRLGLHVSESAFGRFRHVTFPPEFFEQLFRHWHAPSAKVAAHATRNAIEYTRIMELIRSRGNTVFWMLRSFRGCGRTDLIRAIGTSSISAIR